MKFMNNKKSKIAVMLIITILCMSFITNFFMGTQVSAANPVIAPVLYELIVAIMAMLGITVAAGQTDIFDSTGNMYTVADNWLNEPVKIGVFDQIKILLFSIQVATLEELDKLTKGQLLDMFIRNCAEIVAGNADIDNDSITDNQVIIFDDAEKKNLLMHDILTDLRNSEIITSEESLEEMLCFPGTEAQAWDNYNNSPLSITEYPYQTIIEVDYAYGGYESIWFRPVTVQTIYPDLFPNTFPVSDFSRVLLTRRSDNGWFLIQIPQGVNVFRTWDSYYNKWVLKPSSSNYVTKWFYNAIQETWTSSNISVGPGATALCNDFSAVEYYPFNIYNESSCTTVWRTPDTVQTELIGKGSDTIETFYTGYDAEDYNLLICSKDPIWAETVESYKEIRTGTGNDLEDRDYFKLYRYVDGVWMPHENYEEIYALQLRAVDIGTGNVRIGEANTDIYDEYDGISDEDVLEEKTIEVGQGGEVSLNNILELPEVNPFTAETQPSLWDDTSTSISIPNTDVIESFINDDITIEQKEDILTNADAIILDTPVDDVIGWSQPYDDTQVTSGLGVIAQWLNAIWERIGEAIGIMSQSTTADPNEPDLTEKSREFKWPDMFLCIWDVLIACIKLVLRAGVFIVSIFAVPADSSLMNQSMVDSLGFLKNQTLPVPFDITFWNAFSAVMTIVIATLVLKKANRFV